MYDGIMGRRMGKETGLEQFGGAEELLAKMVDLIHTFQFSITMTTYVIQRNFFKKWGSAWKRFRRLTVATVMVPHFPIITLKIHHFAEILAKFKVFLG